MTAKVLQGTVHGRTIELEQEPGLREGAHVEVTVRIKGLPGPPPGWRPEGHDSAAGLMAVHWTDEDDRILAEIAADRKRDRGRAIAP